MIEADDPGGWRDLQACAAQILSECGVRAKIEKKIQTARGEVEIDVWAHDPSATPGQIYLVECKQWRRRVSQTMVHAFRSVVGDSGANWGALISASGFQRGAYTAAQYSNVRLLTWREFQALFAERWLERYFVPTVGTASDPLIEYTEPINSRIFRKADALTDDDNQRFRMLRQQHGPLASFCLVFRAHQLGFASIITGETSMTLNLPLRRQLNQVSAEEGLSDQVLDATAYRELLAALLKEVRNAIVQFDELFGARA